jgi:cobalamin biosynthesis protein CobD/CbiB
MAAAAHALDVRLEKHGHHVLNSAGREPAARDIARATGLVARALVIAGACVAVALTLRGSR